MEHLNANHSLETGNVEDDKKYITECSKQIIQSFVAQDFEQLEKCKALSRVHKEDILRVLGEYGGTLTTIPDEAYHTDAFEITRYRNHSGYFVLIDLWIDNKRSDLTLQLDIKTAQNGKVISIIINDLLVM